MFVPDRRNRSERAVGALLVPLLLVPLFAFAADGQGFRLSGYGTIGYATDDRNNIAPIRDLTQRPHDGLATGATWKMDTRIGVQAEVRVSPEVELVSQFVLRDQASASVGRSFESAYVAWRPRAELDLRLGRLGYDAFLMSDTRNLGYAYAWVRPPTEFYGWIPIFSVNGVDAAYAGTHGDLHWRVKAQAGSSAVKVPMGSGGVGGGIFDFKTNDLLSFTVSASSGPWRVKVGDSRFGIANESAPMSPLHAGLDRLAAGVAGSFPAIAAEAADLRANLSMAGARVRYSTLGFGYDDGRWLAQAEFGHSTATRQVIPQSNSFYFRLGRRFGDWTPYFGGSTVRPGKEARAARSDWSVLGLASGQNQALFVVNSSRMDQRTISAGVRWDFHDQAALKLQWDRTRVEPAGYGLWYRPQAVDGVRSRINLLTVTLDFVF